MNRKVEYNNMKRREILQCGAILFGGLGISQLGLALSREQTAYLAAAGNYNATPIDFLSSEQRKILSAMAEIIIPRSDTPGAIDANVPAFLELMMADWLNDTERAIWRDGLVDIEHRIPAEYGMPFYELNMSDQLEIMEALEESASDADWYDFGSVSGDFDSNAPFICQLKELTIWGFFTSEVGAKQVLRYNAMPMEFNGDTPLSDQESSWSLTGMY